MPLYDESFYAKRHQRTLHSAETVLKITQNVVPPIRSAVDIGCGVGTWLSVLADQGVEDVCGIDGDWVNQQHLKISQSDFLTQNISQDINLPVGKRYDLAISLEVAEHLPAGQADYFVQKLTQASDFVLFSAAIPYQGGTGHVNEQWVEYWLDLFEKNNYVGLDVIRSQIWNDPDIMFWYRQNTILYVSKSRLQDLKLEQPTEQLRPASMIHPEGYMINIKKQDKRLEDMRSLKGSWRTFRRAIKQSVKPGANPDQVTRAKHNY